MKHKIVLFLSTLMLVCSISACGNGKSEETTLTGMVISVDGITVSLREIDSKMQREEMSDMEGFENFNPENFNPEDFESGDFNPENFNPEDFESGDFNPENFNPEDFESGDFNPENFNPEDFEGFEGTEMPQFPENGKLPNGEQPFAEGESTTVDLANAHISVEIENGKASGSIDDIKTGIVLTITMNEKGEVTTVLVSSNMGFGGRIQQDK